MDAKKLTIADEILAGLNEFADALEDGNDDVLQKFTCHRVILDLKPESYSPEKVKTTRDTLSASQVLFAKFLGASVKTVRSWEQGIAEPNPMACRFMDEIRRNPDYYRKRLQESMRPKSKVIPA